MENIIEGNKLIAEFMGYKYFGWNNPDHKKVVSTSGYWARKGAKIHHPKVNIMHPPLRYDSSWDWLMPVVEKIENLHNGNFSFFIVQRECDIPFSSSYKEDGGEWDAPNFANKCNDKKLSTWTCCIQFIQWYNQQNT